MAGVLISGMGYTTYESVLVFCVATNLRKTCIFRESIFQQHVKFNTATMFTLHFTFGLMTITNESMEL
jgi:hypothetical protein